MSYGYGNGKTVKRFYYKITKDKKEPTKITLEGPLEGIYELKPTRSQDANPDYTYVQVIKSNPVASYKEGELLIVKERL